MSVSVIIPCYNSGAYLLEAVDSVKGSSFKGRVEVVIINDGSTEANTLQLLKDLEAQGYRILHQENKGPAAARNTGVRSSAGEYVLFLDSDNRIRNTFLEKAIAVLKESPDVGVVYGNPYFFGEGEVEERFPGIGFDKYNLFKSNQVDMCSMIRRKVWDAVGGLDENREIIGHEDWEFWIRVSETGWKFHHINEPLFDYRVRKDSLVKIACQPEKFERMRQYIYTKHLDRFLQRYEELHQMVKTHEFDKDRPFRSFVKYFYYKYLNKNRR